MANALPKQRRSPRAVAAPAEERGADVRVGRGNDAVRSSGRAFGRSGVSLAMRWDEPGGRGDYRTGEDDEVYGCPHADQNPEQSWPDLPNPGVDKECPIRPRTQGRVGARARRGPSPGTRGQARARTQPDEPRTGIGPLRSYRSSQKPIRTIPEPTEPARRRPRLAGPTCSRPAPSRAVEPAPSRLSLLQYGLSRAKTFGKVARRHPGSAVANAQIAPGAVPVLLEVGCLPVPARPQGAANPEIGAISLPGPHNEYDEAWVVRAEGIASVEDAASTARARTVLAWGRVGPDDRRLLIHEPSCVTPEEQLEQTGPLLPCRRTTLHPGGMSTRDCGGYGRVSRCDVHRRHSAVPEANVANPRLNSRGAARKPDPRPTQDGHCHGAELPEPPLSPTHHNPSRLVDHA